MDAALEATAKATATPPWCLWPTDTAYGRQNWWTLGWDQVDFRTVTLHVRRVKQHC